LRLLGRRLEEFHVDIGGEKRRCSFALVSKVRNYGGDFEIARSVRLFDDRFEVVLFEGRYMARYLKHFAGMMLNRLGAMKGVAVLRTDCVTLSGPQDRRVYVQIDGESAGCLPARDPHRARRPDPADAAGVRRVGHLQATAAGMSLNR